MAEELVDRDGVVYGDVLPGRLLVAADLPFAAWDRYYAVMGATGVICLLVALGNTPLARQQS